MPHLILPFALHIFGMMEPWKLITSRHKFYQLKLSHYNILKNTKSLYNFNEWGFPKGRRESYESDLVCAIREFEEETTLNEKNYIILEKCKSIRENLTGTNGINYTHNYFLSIINDNSCISTDKSNREISQTKVINLNECLEKILSAIVFHQKQ